MIYSTNLRIYVTKPALGIKHGHQNIEFGKAGMRT